MTAVVHSMALRSSLWLQADATVITAGFKDLFLPGAIEVDDFGLERFGNDQVVGQTESSLGGLLQRVDIGK